MQQLNPSIKAITILLAVLFISFIFDPLTLLIYLGWVVLTTITFGKVPLKIYFAVWIPFLLFAAGMLWTAIAFAKPAPIPADMVSFLWWNVADSTLQNAFALSLRVLSYAGLSLLFIFTTDKTGFIISLVQQCKVPPKIAYGILAGYRFLPMLKDELATIRAAQIVRGMPKQGFPFAHYRRYMIPLLASAIRKSERTAAAMEAKGFTGSRNRTYYRRYFITWKDICFLLFMLIPLPLGYFILNSL